MLEYVSGSISFRRNTPLGFNTEDFRSLIKALTSSLLFLHEFCHAFW